MELIERIDAARERWNVLEHPFYKRWSCGELTRGELRTTQASIGTPSSRSRPPRRRPATRSTRARKQARLRSGTSSPPPSAPGPIASRAPRRPSASTPGPRPEPARGAGGHVRDRGGAAGDFTAKLEGLAEHYGVAVEEPGAEYFELHSERDHEHAAESRRELELVHDADEDRLVEVAEAALRGNWTLLDGVEARG